MTDKRKKRIREIVTKTGMSYAAAANQLRASKAPVLQKVVEPNAVERPAPVLMAMVNERYAWAIQVGRMLSAHVEVHDPVRTHFAYGEHVRAAISKFEHDALVAVGATALHDTGKRAVQNVRIGAPTYELGCSVQCAACRRWLWAGAQVSGTCICGQRYEVTFAGEPDHLLPLGRRCMDCGCEDMLTEDHERRNPWRAVSEFQAACRMCWRASYWSDPEQHVMRTASPQLRGVLNARRRHGPGVPASVPAKSQ